MLANLNTTDTLVSLNPKTDMGGLASFEQLSAHISADHLASILTRLVDTASPTGEEGPLAREIVTILEEYNLEGKEQVIDTQQSNAIGKISGETENSGRNLLLYAPIDTVTSNNAEEDLPWLSNSEELPSEARAQTRFNGEFLTGLGAHNPKGHAACIIEAARVLKNSGISLGSDLLLGFGAGGMPSDARQGTRKDSGHGAGCAHILAHRADYEFAPDCALIAKSGWSISYEEVGLIWFEVVVEGIHNYSGARHLMPYKNPILDASALMLKLDQWLQDWPKKYESGLVAPQGVISFIESGWERMPSFTPEVCRFRVDLRLSPRTTGKRAEEAFASALKEFSEELGIQTGYKTLVCIPGTSTPPNEPIISQSIKSWEEINQKPHAFIEGMSGATDANILRAGGLPTARVGLPKADIPDINFQRGMNTVAIKDLVKLTQLLIHVALNICGQTNGGKTSAGVTHG